MKLLQSIRWHIQIWHSLLLIVLVCILGILFYFHEKQRYLAEIDQTLQASVPMLFPRIDGVGGPSHRRGPPGGGRRDPSPYGARDKGNPPQTIEGGGMTLRMDKELSNVFADKRLYFVAWSYDGDEPLKSDNAPEGLAPVEGLEYEGTIELRTFAGNREAFDATPHLRCVIVGMSLSHVNAVLTDLKLRIIAGGVGLVFGGIFIGWLITGIAVRPFYQIREVARKITSGDLSARVPEKYKHGEIGELATDLNTSFSSLESSFNLQRQFTADAAHELRSPIAAMMLETQVSLRREREEGSYKSSLEVCERKLREINLLTEGLLDLSRLDSGEAQLDALPTDLTKITEDCVEFMKGLIESRSISIKLMLSPAVCVLDADKMKQVVLNLLSNALIHSSTGTEVTIETGVEGKHAYLTIKDQGPGISTEEQANLFQRFFRGNQARKENRNGTGLGLAISQKIVHLHGGEITLESMLGVGSLFTIRLSISGE